MKGAFLIAPFFCGTNEVFGLFIISNSAEPLYFRFMQDFLWAIPLHGAMMFFFIRRLHQYLLKELIIKILLVDLLYFISTAIIAAFLQSICVFESLFLTILPVSWVVYSFISFVLIFVLLRIRKSPKRNKALFYWFIKVIVVFLLLFIMIATVDSGWSF